MKLRIFARTELSKTMSSSSSLSLSENANIIFQSSTTENEENCQHTNFFLYVFNNDDNDKMTAIYGKMLLARNEAFPFLLLCCSFHITMKMFSAFLNIFFHLLKWTCSFISFAISRMFTFSSCLLHVVPYEIISFFLPLLHSQFRDIAC